ncbi:MAG: hypothetical protein HY824_02070 [Acidobacteria bacterium]|nr:hypothetical protein [Acidobacteriota bacterium]
MSEVSDVPGVRFGIAAALAVLIVIRVAAQEKPAEMVGGCPAEPLAFHACALQKARTFNPPRTPGGKPDLQGYWRSRLTQAFSVEGVPADEPLIHDPIMPWEAAPPEVIDPADRKIPYQPWAAAIGRRGVNFTQYVDPRTTCSTAGIPRLALQDANQILQPWGDQYVLWAFEDHHNQRVIAMDGRPPVGPAIKTWNGLARGRWEGNTLVIETTNLNGYNWIDDAGNFYTDAVRVTERLTLIDPDTIDFTATFEDPKAYTRPWTVAWALVRAKEPGFELLEEACREGERSLDRIRETTGMKFYFGEPWRGR